MYLCARIFASLASSQLLLFLVYHQANDDYYKIRFLIYQMIYISFYILFIYLNFGKRMQFTHFLALIKAFLYLGLYSLSHSLRSFFDFNQFYTTYCLIAILLFSLCFYYSVDTLFILLCSKSCRTPLSHIAQMQNPLSNIQF